MLSHCPITSNQLSGDRYLMQKKTVYQGLNHMPASSPPVSSSTGSSTSGIGSSSSSTINGSANASIIGNGTNSSTPGATNSTGSNGSISDRGGGGGGGGGGVGGGGGAGSNGEQLSRTNLYIRGLAQHTTDKDLLHLCGTYGNIISTKAILDKNTNKCKGYGFVDFESPVAAEAAVKALQLQGIQAQMAKCTDTSRSKNAAIQNSIVVSTAINSAAATAYSNCNFVSNRQPQQEQDPTNLYIANLPAYMQEGDLENMLSQFGSVISTRILRDGNQHPRGVGFARMDSKDKCDLIIQTFNGKTIMGCKEPLLVKFADGGNKKKTTNRNGPPGGSNGASNNGWRDSNSADPNAGGLSTLHYHHHHDQSMSNANGVNQAAAVAAASAALMANPSMAAAAAAAAQYGQARASAAAAAAAGYPTGPMQASPYSHHQQATGFHHQPRGGPYNAATASGQMASSAFAPPPPSAYHQSARPAFASASAAALQTSQQQAAAAAAAYQGVAAAALQAAGHPAWVHPAAAAAPQYHLVQSPPGPPQMIGPSHQTMLHLSALMPQLSAQMQQLSLSGASYMTGAPSAYASPGPGALYAAQGTPLIQQVALTDANSGNGSNDPTGQHGSGASSVGPQDDASLVAASNGKNNQPTPYGVCGQSK